MPAMAFIGVRNSWLMLAREGTLGAAGSLGQVACLCKLPGALRHHLLEVVLVFVEFLIDRLQVAVRRLISW